MAGHLDVEQRRDAVLERLRGTKGSGGLSAELVRQAAAAADVSPRTVYRWLAQGELDPAEPCLVVSTESLRHPRQVALAPAVVAALWALGRLEPSEFVLPFRSSTRARQRLRRLQVRAGVPIEAGRSLDRLRSVSGVDA